MGLKQSNTATSRLEGGFAEARGYSSTPPGRSTVVSNGGAEQGRSRTLSLGNFLAASVHGDASLSFSTSASNATVNGTPADSDDDYSTDDGELFGATLSSSLPTQLTFYQGIIYYKVGH